MSNEIRDGQEKAVDTKKGPVLLTVEEHAKRQRLTAPIFAAVMHVPMVGVSYDPKIDRFLQIIGEEPAGSLHNVTVDGLLAKVRALWPEIRRPNREREERIGRLRQKAFHNAELALTLVENRKRG